MLLVVIGIIAAVVVFFMKPRFEGKPVLDVGSKLSSG